MAMSKVIRVLEKSIAPSPHSVLLEHRNKTDCILFESHVCALLTQQENVIRKQYTKVCIPSTGIPFMLYIYHVSYVYHIKLHFLMTKAFYSCAFNKIRRVIRPAVDVSLTMHITNKICI